MIPSVSMALIVALAAIAAPALPVLQPHVPPPPPRAHGVPQPSCPVPGFLQIGDYLDAPHTRTELVAVRRRIVDSAAVDERFVVCTLRAGQNLEAAWKAAGRAPDALVERAVDNAIQTFDAARRVTEVEFNDAAERLKDGGPPLPPFALDAHPPFDPAVQPRGPGLLTMPAFVDTTPNGCGRSRDVHGVVDVLYDVSATGAIANMTIVRSSGAPDAEADAKRCVEIYGALPAIVNGVPVASTGYLQHFDF